MKHLDAMKLAATPCAWYAKAKGSKRKRQSEWLRRAAVETYFHGHYGAFDQTIATVNTAPAPSKQRRLDRLMLEFYLHPPQTLDEALRNRRHEHGLGECPSCGNPLMPDTLDHFLPKEHWPEFSILPNNLVPQCRDCAGHKGTRYYCGTNMRAMFVHPMYSAALASVRFRIDVSLHGGRPQFAIKISVKAGTSDTDMERIKLHLAKLHVRERIQTFCVRHWSHWREKVETLGVDIEVMFQGLVGPTVTSPNGRNWAMAFMKGVLRDADVLAALGKKPLLAPPPPEDTVELVWDGPGATGRSGGQQAGRSEKRTRPPKAGPATP